MPGGSSPTLPLRHGGDEGRKMLQLVGVGFLGLGYIVISTGMISFNKYLIHGDRFPYAVPLVWLHTIFCSLLSVVLLFFFPSLFPSLTDPAKKVEIDRSLFLTGTLPIAAFFSIQLILSNTAFLHCSVAFLQFLKEGNTIIVYAFSVMLGLQRFTWRSMGILVFLLLATTMTIHGEIHFSYKGFLLKLSSQIFESAKTTMSSLLLSNVGRKLDAQTYVLFVMPFCFVFVGMTMIGLHLAPQENFQMPAWADVLAWWPFLLLNAVMAFCLNISIALFVKHSSAMAFQFAGIVKDVCIVGGSWLIFHDAIAFQQVIGFGLQLTAIGLWTAIKMYPERFEDGILSGVARLLCSSFTTKEKDAALAPFGASAALSYSSNAAGAAGAGASVAK